MKNKEVAVKLVKAGVVIMPEKSQWWSCEYGCEHEKEIISCSCKCHEGENRK